MIDVSYPSILKYIEPHIGANRTESASFLIWYLENYLRLDRLEATDSVCDKSGDKGIDGIYLNPDANVIEVYQAKLSQKAKSSIGDKSLREFQGTLSQFATEETLRTTVESAGEADVSRLIERLEIIKHLAEFEVIGFFICNTELDDNGRDFLKASPNIRFIGKSDLERTFVPAARMTPARTPASFSITGYDISEYIVDAEHKAIIAPVKAGELVAMDGIENQAVFAYNVRGPLGRTQVNRDIAKSISEHDKHKLFPLFHNGITVVAEKVLHDADTVSVENYFVVNGCQSLTALYKNKRNLSDDLRVLTKFIQTPPGSQLAEIITRFSNNQNGVRARDFKSNNHIQIRLQNEFQTMYGSEFFYEIKRGESAGVLPVISNELAGQYLMAFDLKTPWATHRKYQIFEDLHSDIFGRPIVTAHRILMCHVLGCRVEVVQSRITNVLFAQYALTKFFLLYVLRLIMENDPTAAPFIERPEIYVQDSSTRMQFGRCVDTILSEVITDLNAEIDQLGVDFDYRGKLRDEKWCKQLAHEIAATHKKLVERKRLEPFMSVYNESAQQAAAADAS